MSYPNPPLPRSPVRGSRYLGASLENMFKLWRQQLGQKGEPMTEKEAEYKAIEIFGEDSFAETDGDGCYYVGALPAEPGPYTAYMGFSYKEAFTQAIEDRRQ